MTQITTSRSAVSCYQTCPRKRWLNYEMPNQTSTPGYERRALAIPLATGIFVHHGLECALKAAMKGQTDIAAGAAGDARDQYLKEVEARGLQIEEGTDAAAVIEEQAAHVEAMVLAWYRVRLPRWLDEFEIVEVEVEDRVPLSDDVTLAVRADAIVRRKYDHRMFVVNFKTVGNADDRWMRAWELDMQLMTELLAAERRHGHQFGGVIIEGIVKGARVGVDERLVEVRGGDKKPTSYIDRSKLLYGYKCDADPPLVPLQYQWESTTRKGWHKFRTWQEPFTTPPEMPPVSLTQYKWLREQSPMKERFMTSLEYWINWLPEEVVESCFITVPPIMRSQEMIDRKVTQIVAIERRIREGTQAVTLATEGEGGKQWALDAYFPQNEKSCVYPGKCSHLDACWTANVALDMEGSGLFRPRVDHHAGNGASE